MVRTADAKYILGEIRNIHYYQERIARAQARLREIDLLIKTATDPASPNGGDDVWVNGKKVRVKIHGSGQYDSGRAISEYITAQAPLQAEARLFRQRYATAQAYREQVLQSEERAFVEAFLDGRKTYRELQDEFFVTNPYDKMIRIIANTVKKV